MRIFIEIVSISIGLNVNLKQYFYLVRIPKESDKRRQWIDSINKHQQLAPEDAIIQNFNVCCRHFKPEHVRRTNSRVTAITYPTIFPIQISNDRSVPAPSSSSTFAVTTNA